MIEQTPINVPIFYMGGPFTYDEAVKACQSEGKELALREDIEEAEELGYNRCSFGWLRDMHVAMIIQQPYASVDCDGGRVGALYKPAREPDHKYSGAYCVKDQGSIPTLEEMRIGSNRGKTVNWWVTTDPMDAFNLRHALTSVTRDDDAMKYPLMTSLKSVYTCCNSFNITHTLEEKPTTYVQQRYSIPFLRKVVDIYRRELAPVRVIAHVSARYDAMIRYGAATTNKTNTISDLVELAASAGLDGLIMDYEPRENYSREHAETYIEFIDELATAMWRKSMTLGTVVSSWGILKYYDVYNSSKADFLASMSSTYYGTNVASNKQHVTDMLKSINVDRLEIGLGLMHEPELIPKPKRNFRWSEEKIRDFVTWFDAEGIKRIHVYPGHWRSHKTSAEYFLNTLSEFSQD